MAEGEGTGNTGVVAVFAIVVIVLVAAFFAWQGGMLGGSGRDTDINVELNAPKAAPESPGAEMPDQPAEAPQAAPQTP